MFAHCQKSDEKVDHGASAGSSRVLRRYCIKSTLTFGEKVAILAEDEGATHGHHEVFVGALHNNRALSFAVRFLQHMRNFRAPNSIGVVDHMEHPIFFGKDSQLVHPVWYSGGETTGGRHHCQDILSPDLFYFEVNSLQVSAKNVALEFELHHDRNQICCVDSLEAGLLVDSGPYHVLSFGPLFVESQQGHGETHASGKRQRQHFLYEFIVELMQSADCEVLGKLKHKATTCSFRLVGHDISTSANSMPHMKMSFLHNPRKYSRFSLSDSYFMVKIVAIHQGKSIEDVLDGEVVEGLEGELALSEQLFHGFLSFVDGVLGEADVGRGY